MVKYLLIIPVGIVSFIAGWIAWNPFVRNQPPDIAILTASRLIELDSAAIRFHERCGRLPDSLSEMENSGLVSDSAFFDGWGKPFFYVKNDNSSFKIFSFGTHLLSSADPNDYIGETLYQISITNTIVKGVK